MYNAIRGDNMIISLIGKSGSGKGLVADLLVKSGPNIIHCDIDCIGHEVTNISEVQKQLVTEFGSQILEEGKINRKELGKIVFKSPEKMEKLTDITWSSMERKIDTYMEENKESTIILDWQLLPKTKYFITSNIRILVDAPIELRKERTMKRDKITAQKFFEREEAALPISKEQVDYVIENIDIEKTKEKVKRIYEKNIISR